MTHTPGPWRAMDKMVVVVAETHGYDTCIANAQIGGSSADAMRANARLIAAAPELLEALQNLAAFADRVTGSIEPPPPALARAWEVIAKARGQA